MIAVEGQLQSRSWDGQDGKRQYATEVVVDNAFFTGSKSEGGATQQTGAYQSNFASFDAPGEPVASQPADDSGFVDLSFANDMGSEDDLPF